MLWETMKGFLESWFYYPGLEWYLILVSICLAVVFGIIWLLGHQPPLAKKPGLWGVAIASAFLTVLAMTFVQIPLQYYYGEAIISSLSQRTIADLLLLIGIPTVLITGLVQEGAKMIPMVFWWQRSGRQIEPKEGLIIGAMAGVGFGIFEAVWMHNQAFMAGWTWDYVSFGGFEALIPFWERFWTIAIHIALSAIAGYGLAKGKGFPFYLLAAFLHGAVNYMTILYSKGVFTTNQLEIVIAAMAALMMLAALWLRWRKDGAEPSAPVETIEPVAPDMPTKPDV
jgi:RsiW-degrading membrane proteinase PrsW (M82 family)